MARTITAPELTLLNSSQFNWHIRVLVANPDGALQEMTALSGLDHLLEVDWGGSVLDLVESGSVTLLKKVGTGQSLVPYDEASTLNRKAGAYEEYLRAGREVQVYWALTAKGAAASVWYFGFHGRLDEVDWTDQSRIRVPFRDLGALLADADIADELEYPQGTLEATIQSALNNTLGSGVVTLHTPVATGKTLPAFTLAPGNLYEVLRKLARDNGSFDLRYKFDAGTGTFRLTLYLPDLVGTTPHFNLSGNEYLRVLALKKNRDGLKNIVRVVYHNGFVQATDAPSVEAYGPRFEEIDTGLDTPAQASVVAVQFLSDRAYPAADHQIENLFYPIVELRDVAGWAAQTDWFNVAKNWSVVSWHHTVANNGEAHTVVSTRERALLAGLESWSAGGAASSDVIVENFLTGYSGENLLAAALNREPLEVKTQAEEWVLVVAYVSRVLFPNNDMISGSMKITPSISTDAWRARIRFYTNTDTLLGEWSSDTGAYGVGEAYVTWKDRFVPAGTARIHIGIAGFSYPGYGAPTGTATYRFVSVNRGPLAAPYSAQASLQNAAVRAAIAASHVTHGVVNEPFMRSGMAGTPGEIVLGLPVTNRTGDLTIVDPVTRKVGNADLLSDVRDSTNRTVNRMYAKVLSTDLDNVDYIVDGATFAKTLVTALTSGQVDLSKAGVIQKYAANIARSGGDATAVSAIVASLTNTGNAASAFRVPGRDSVERKPENQREADVHITQQSGVAVLGDIVEGLVRSGLAGVPGAFVLATAIMNAAGDLTLIDPVAKTFGNGSLLANVADSTTRAVNRMFAKPLVGDPDNQDGVADGTTYQRVLASFLSTGQVIKIRDATDALTLDVYAARREAMSTAYLLGN